MPQFLNQEKPVIGSTLHENFSVLFCSGHAYSIEPIRQWTLCGKRTHLIAVKCVYVLSVYGLYNNVNLNLDWRGMSASQWLTLLETWNAPVLNTYIVLDWLYWWTMLLYWLLWFSIIQSSFCITALAVLHGNSLPALSVDTCMPLATNRGVSRRLSTNHLNVRNSLMVGISF